MIRKLLLASVLLAAAALPAAAQQNIFSAQAGARVVGSSSNYGGGWDVSNLVLGETGGEIPVWCTEDDAPFPHWAVIELPRPTWVSTLVFNNAIPDEEGYPGISARDVQVLVSNESATAGFRPVASFALARNRNNQEVRIEPAQARWVKIQITSNWGNPTWTELGQLGGFDDGTRPAEIAAALRTSGAVDVYGIYFDFGTAALRPESAPVLEQIAAALRDDPALRLVVEGHTDAVGVAAANQRLSEQRAAAVVQALADKGVDRARLTPAGFGPTRPVADNGTPVGRAKNRRVSLRVQQ